ncbi:MAG: DUF4920 domain-containing protein [Chitinophagaceae bacterium]|jgi:hypothetical protein|nr:DUF4920 domain-containing protein [Chitinophagaceae bacterium]
MKKLLLAATFAMAGFWAAAQEGKDYGEAVKSKKAVSVSKMKSKMDAKDEWSGVVTGTVKQVCKSEGCWLRLDDGSKDGIMVKMKDHSFFVPKDIDGKTVYVSGKAVRKTTSVKELQHFAEDAGKSKEEIAKITEPKVEITMEATGVKVMQ